MFRRFAYRTVFTASTIVVLVLIGLCPAWGQEVEELGRARISPSIVHLEPGGEQQFHAIMMATRLRGSYVAEDATWAVNDIPGGNETLGTITQDGLYRAPAATPSTREIHICATAPEAVNKRLWATVMMPAPGPAYKLLSEWVETADTPDNKLVDPHCIALDKEGNLLIADYNGSRVLRFTRDGKFLGDLGKPGGEDPGYVTLPRVVTTDDEGNIFVSDQKSDKPRIQVFSHEGEFLKIFAEKGTRPGDILRAHGIAFDSQRRLHVVDVDNMRVNVYTHDGEFLYDWGKDGDGAGDFNAPHGIAIDPNDELFVTGYYLPCKKFTATGEYLFSFAHGEPPDGAVYCHSVASDRWGNVYLMVRGQRGYGGALEDNEGNKVSMMKFNNNGDYVSSLTLAVKAHSENWAAVDQDGLVYALFEGGDRRGVEVFAPQ